MLRVSLQLILHRLLTALATTFFWSFAHAEPTPSDLGTRDNNPLNIDWYPAPDPADGPPISAGALRDTKYLPAQIGGIVAAYGVSLVLVAITLLALAKKRREHLQAADEGLEFEDRKGLYDVESPVDQLDAYCPQSTGPVPNFSYPSPTKTHFSHIPPFPPFSQAAGPTPYIQPSRASALSGCPGVDPSVDQTVVAADREMAQSQLEDMYKYVMEHEDAKQRGVVLDAPAAGSQHYRVSNSDKSVSTTLSKRDRLKPASLVLSNASDDKSQSRTSSFFSALRSPRKKQVKGVNISSPIMTPQSATFPRHDTQEIASITPRSYAPAPPPPVPTDQVPFGVTVGATTRASGAPITPDLSPQSVQSIDERITDQLPVQGQSMSASHHPSEADPESATTEHSQTPLVGLPTSPKPGARFPSLPTSPKPGATFKRASPPTAVRTGGNLPLRAYEPALSSPSAIVHTTKQTVFERKGPLSPGTGRTPMTAGAVPYSPYQPFTPVIPMTPSLVTKEDRRRMKRMVPKTPTMEMVQSSDDVW